MNTRYRRILSAFAIACASIFVGAAFADGPRMPVVDGDADGIPDEIDDCPYTPPGTAVDSHGCPLTDDEDGDGVPNAQDDCPYTPKGAVVDARGCALDTDFDGVPDGLDQCPHTALGERVDARGCADGEQPTGAARVPPRAAFVPSGPPTRVEIPIEHEPAPTMTAKPERAPRHKAQTRHGKSTSPKLAPITASPLPAPKPAPVVPAAPLPEPSISTPAASAAPAAAAPPAETAAAPQPAPVPALETAKPIPAVAAPPKPAHTAPRMPKPVGKPSPDMATLKAPSTGGAEAAPDTPSTSVAFRGDSATDLDETAQSTLKAYGAAIAPRLEAEPDLHVRVEAAAARSTVSESRASMVRAFLIAQGVDGSRIETGAGGNGNKARLSVVR